MLMFFDLWLKSSKIEYARDFTVSFFLISFLRKLFFFEFGNCSQFKKLLQYFNCLLALDFVQWAHKTISLPQELACFFNKLKSFTS